MNAPNCIRKSLSRYQQTERSVNTQCLHSTPVYLNMVIMSSGLAIASYLVGKSKRPLEYSRGNVDASLFHIKIRFFIGHQDQHGQN